jgi:hypothetical protein
MYLAVEGAFAMICRIAKELPPGACSEATRSSIDGVVVGCDGPDRPAVYVELLLWPPSPALIFIALCVVLSRIFHWRMQSMSERSRQQKNTKDLFYEQGMQLTKLGAEVTRLEAELDRLSRIEDRLTKDLTDQDRILRASVPEEFKHATCPIGCAQNYIAHLERIEIKYDNLCAVLNEQAAEIKRLRAAVEEAIAYVDADSSDGAEVIAAWRSALEPPGHDRAVTDPIDVEPS